MNGLSGTLAFGHEAAGPFTTTTLSWDGRLDNRAELLSQLRDATGRDAGSDVVDRIDDGSHASVKIDAENGIDGRLEIGARLGADSTDAAIVAVACARWGTVPAIGRLVGDFALVRWDAARRTLTLARDFIGARPLYYYVDRARALWASDLGALLDAAQDAHVSTSISDHYVADFLLRNHSVVLTPYRGIKAVRPGHALTIDMHGGVTEQAFWTLTGEPSVRYATDAGYEAHFRDVFREAVQVRLRSAEPVIADLSGGLDSSSIVCMADDILQAGDAGAPSIETLSYVFDESKTADEREWIHHIEARRGRHTHEISDRDHRFFALVGPGWPGRMPSWRLLSSDFDRALVGVYRRLGAHVRLSGQGGDHMMVSAPKPGPELRTRLAQGRVRGTLDALRTWSTALKRPFTALLMEELVAPSLPRFMRQRVSRGPGYEAPPWVTARCLAHAGAQDEPHPASRPRGPNARATHDALQRAVVDVNNSGWPELDGIESTFPFLHRPLVELVAAIPFDQRLRPGETRSLQRRALAGILPEATRARTSKGNPGEVICRALAREVSTFRRLVSDARICAYGFVDRTALRDALERAAVGHDAHMGALLATLRLEYWLQLEETRPRTAADPIATAQPHEPALAHRIGAAHWSNPATE